MRELKSSGADFIKIYNPSFQHETFDALMDEARSQKLSVVGHLPLLSHEQAKSFDPEWANDLITQMVQHNVWVTPTLAAVPSRKREVIRRSAIRSG
jgi:hypothetical protein